MDETTTPSNNPLVHLEDQVDQLIIASEMEAQAGLLERPIKQLTTHQFAGQTFKCIYFFAGIIRKFDVRFWLQQLCDKHNFILEMEEVDLLRPGNSCDLAIVSTQESWIARLSEFNAVLVTPPCSSFSRATWANNRGPTPVRSASFPRGFPWLSEAGKRRANLGNILCDFNWAVLEEIQKIRAVRNVVAFSEHPEDLGRIRNRGPADVPASIWQSERFATLVKLGWWSGAFKQDKYGALTAKPTRSLSDSFRFANIAPMSIPTFTAEGFYAGPLEHSTKPATYSMMRQSDETGPFRTAAAASYPPLLCKQIAENLFFTFLWRLQCEFPSGGENEDKLAVKVGFPPAPPGGSQRQPMVTTSIPPSGVVEVPLPKLRFSFTATDKLRLEQRLLDRKVLTAELKDPPPSPGNVSNMSSSAVTPQTVKKQTCKWELVEGKDYTKAGFWGIGQPIHIQKVAGRFGRPMQDGGGLCCPGRWRISQRTFPSRAKFYTESMDKWLDNYVATTGKDALQDVVYGLMSGKASRHPFEGMLGDLKHEWATELASRGFTRPKAVWCKGRTIDFGFLHMLGADLEDPDFSSMSEFCIGAKLGVDHPLPRTDTVWPPKGKWPLDDFESEPCTPINGNYPSVALHKDALLKEIDEQLSRGWVVATTLGEAQKRFGNVTIASLAVIQDAEDKFRTLYDGTNRVRLNHRIRVPDSELCPSALDIQAAISEDELLRQPILGLVIDIEKAHQNIPTCEEDWGHVGFSPDPMPNCPIERDSWRIYLKTVGTYGVASASFHWSRLASLVQRIAYYTCALSFLFRYADDFLLLASNLGNSRFTMQVCRFLILLGVCDIPVKWPKTNGGFKVSYIGYLFDFERLLGGLTQKRCLWLVGWLRKVRDERIVVGRELRSGIGRLSFSGVLWRWMLPFLGPFYAWIAVSSDSLAAGLPSGLLILMDWIAEQIEENSMVTLRHLKPAGLGKYFKADARADGDTVIVGGFEAFPDSTLKQSRWFSFVLSPALTPWAYVKEGEAFRTIASLELFSTLLCVMLFVEQQPSSSISTIFITGVTDNQGNESLICKNMTSKFPLYIVLLELTEQLKRRNISVDLRWQSRETNIAADDLTNNKFSEFDPSLRINPDLNSLEWLVLPRLLKEATELDILIRGRKQSTRALGATTPTAYRGQKRKKVGMRFTDPW